MTFVFGIISVILFGFANGQICLKQTIYSDSTTCDGEAQVDYEPVGTSFDDSCVTVDMPYDLGPMVTATYCDMKARLHMESILGAQDCSVSKDDDSVEFTQDLTFHSDKCIGTITGQSFIFECIAGSCPEDTDVTSRTTERNRELFNVLESPWLVWRHRMA